MEVEMYQVVHGAQSTASKSHISRRQCKLHYNYEGQTQFSCDPLMPQREREREKERKINIKAVGEEERCGGDGKERK